MGQPEEVRGRKRLAALGLPPEDGPQDAVALESSHRAFYEAERARYTHLAAGGLHLAPAGALYGMVTQAIKDAHGWDRLPDDWPDEHPTWPIKY